MFTDVLPSLQCVHDGVVEACMSADPLSVVQAVSVWSAISDSIGVVIASAMLVMMFVALLAGHDLGGDS